MDGLHASDLKSYLSLIVFVDKFDLISYLFDRDLLFNTIIVDYFDLLSDFEFFVAFLYFASMALISFGFLPTFLQNLLVCFGLLCSWLVCVQFFFGQSFSFEFKLLFCHITTWLLVAFPLLPTSSVLVLHFFQLFPVIFNHLVEDLRRVTFDELLIVDDRVSLFASFIRITALLSARMMLFVDLVAPFVQLAVGRVFLFLSAILAGDFSLDWELNEVFRYGERMTPGLGTRGLLKVDEHDAAVGFQEVLALF